MTVETETETNVLDGTKNKRLRHIVSRKADGTWEDTALCGYIWDMLKVPDNGTICEKCVRLFNHGN